MDNKQSIWHNLTKEQKDILLEKYLNREHIEVKGIKDGTLRRYLRKYREELEEENFSGNRTKVTDMGKNVKEIESSGERIITLEQLKKIYNIGEEWEIVKLIANKWEVGRKNTKKRVVWENGVIIEGIVEDFGDINTSPLFQVKATFVRKEPIEVKPVIKPVNINLGKSLKLDKVDITPSFMPKHGGVSTSLIVADPHFGFERSLRTGKLSSFHDRQALHIILMLTQRVQFDNIFVLGDIIDFADWSDKFVRSPTFFNTTQPSIIEAGWWFAKLRQYSPKANIVAFEGNHDQRFGLKVINHIKAGYDLRAFDELSLPPAWSVPKLLGLDNINVTWMGGYPENGVWLNEDMYLEHSNIARSTPGGTAAAFVKDRDHSTTFGHVHRVESATRRVTRRNKSHVIKAYCPGCIAKVDGSLPGSTPKSNFSQGFGIIVTDDKYFSHITHFDINDGVSYCLGSFLQGSENVYLKQLRQDVGEDNLWGF